MNLKQHSQGITYCNLELDQLKNIVVSNTGNAEHK